MNWGLIGCGVIGERRALALPEGVKLIICYDINPSRAKRISELTGAKIAATLDEALNPLEVDAVIVATINSAIIEVAQNALSKKIPMLIEKPAARSFAELSKIQDSKVPIKIGFNHRFHPAFLDLVSEIISRPNDPIMFIRAQYGNGARVGFDKEWRSQVEISGGGELLDQGVHLIDLASVLLPGLKVVSGYSKTHYWNMNVDDDTWALLNHPDGATFSFHVSSTEWKNEFRFEVYTRTRKYQWLGLGRSYGAEKLFIYKMKPEMGPPDCEERSYPDIDNSWRDENLQFQNMILKNAKPNGGLQDALSCLKCVEDIYQKSADAQAGEKHPRWWQGGVH